jgi:sirohydrochlorin ferrochelatase
VLVIAAHGSPDPRFAPVVEAIAAGVRRLRPGLDVRVGYLDHGPPSLPDVATPGSVVVPLLLSSGYHVRIDIPAQVPDAMVTAPVAGDVRLLDVARSLAERTGTLVEAAFLSAASPPLDAVLRERPAAAVASYLIAPGAFHDATVATGARLVSAPIGAHEVVPRIVLDRYDAGPDRGP